MSNAANRTAAKALPGHGPEFKVVSHSNFVYWWPVWSLGFVMTAIAFAQGTRLAIVPEGSSVRAVTGEKGLESFVLTVPGKPTGSLSRAAAVPSGGVAFPCHIAHNPVLHLIYAFVVLVVILSSSVTLRGLWSVMNLMAILVIALVLVILGWWGAIIEDLGRLRLYASAAAYFFTSLVLFLYWLGVIFVFDRRRFIIFSPGQIIVHREVGDRQAVYDTNSVTVVKRRNDFIRHRILGLGAGDLIVSTGDGRYEFELPNVLFADRMVREIAETMKARPVLTG